MDVSLAGMHVPRVQLCHSLSRLLGACTFVARPVRLMEQAGWWTETGLPHDRFVESGAF